MTTAYDLVYVRKEEEPILAPPRSEVGVMGWLLGNLLSSFTNMLLTVFGIAFLFWAIPPTVEWALINAVWIGDSRDACLAPEAGACWAFVEAKFGQFMYGRYPVDERWRVDLTAILLVAGLVPIAIPRVPFKRANAIFLLLVFPIVALILLTGGNFGISVWAMLFLVAIGCVATGLIAMASSDGSSPMAARVVAPVAAALAVAAFVASYFVDFGDAAFLGVTMPVLIAACGAMALASLVAGAAAIASGRGFPGAGAALSTWVLISALVLVATLLAADFGLRWVETPLWGGLLITLVVAVVGIVGSMPLGVVLALGRRSKLPVVKFICIVFIEFVRGVPLITVLFMASVMLPLFLPPGATFDKLLRALIGVTLFAGSYMAEVVRGGLQAIPRGQYEAAQAVGLNYWKTMRLIILPQALKIVIPGIVNSFISLFKDTSLVLIIGIFDLLGIVQFNFTDANWASPKTPATGYVFAALVFWAFCFGMSRYSIYTERRLDTGYRR